MKTILRRTLAAAATLAALLTAPVALATPTISITAPANASRLPPQARQQASRLT